MEPVSIRIVALGQLPANFDRNKLLCWSSKIFKLNQNIETFQLNEDAKGDDWEYTDNQLEKYFNKKFDEDFVIIILNVKLQHNWYVRRLSGNRVLFTFFELNDILNLSDIPLHNILLRVIYAATLVYKRYGNRIPPAHEQSNYAHDEMRGCLFDMNPTKWDVVHSCNGPKICDYCVAELKKEQVSDEVIKITQSEIIKIRKPLFYRLGDFVKQHPLWSILISLFTAIIVGIISSILATSILVFLES